MFERNLLAEFDGIVEVSDVHTTGTLSGAQFQLLLGEIISAAVRNVFAVMLRTVGDSIIATVKIKRIVFTFDGLLNVNERAINQSEKIHQDQDSQDVQHYQQHLQMLVQIVLSDHCSKYQTQIAHKVLDCLQNPMRFVYVKSQRFDRL
jgi:hypothetical protein